MLMVHASSTKTWQTTFDGREGFQEILLRRGFPLTDLPRTGRAGQGCAPMAYEPGLSNDQASFTSWRLGTWLPGGAAPTFYPGVRFPTDDPEALDEFLRIQYPEFNAPENEQVETDASAPKPNTVLLDPVLADNVSDEGKATLQSWQVDGLDPLWPLGLEIEGFTTYTPEQAVACKGPGE